MLKAQHAFNGLIFGFFFGFFLGEYYVDMIGFDVIGVQIKNFLGIELFMGIVVGLSALFGQFLNDLDTLKNFRHRKTFHNAWILLILMLIHYFFGFLQFLWVGYFSHLVLDFFGSARGIGFFYPVLRKEFGGCGVKTSAGKWKLWSLTFGITFVECLPLILIGMAI